MMLSVVEFYASHCPLRGCRSREVGVDLLNSPKDPAVEQLTRRCHCHLVQVLSEVELLAPTEIRNNFIIHV